MVAFRVWVGLVSGCIILFYGICACADDTVLNLADRIFDSGNYEDAITEYKRFIFFNPTSDSVEYAYYKIGLAYRNEKRWRESMDALRQSIQSAGDDSIRNQREIDLSVVLIASENYSAAEFQLLRIESFSKFPTLKKKASFFCGVASLYSFKWKEARGAFGKYFSPKDESFLRIDSLLSKAEELNYKSPELAKWLSTFLPGIGQIYAGDWRFGLNALLLNGATGYLLFNNLLKGDYHNAVLIYFLLCRRYYLGNRYHAEKITEDYNNSLNKQLVQKLIISIGGEQK